MSGSLTYIGPLGGLLSVRCPAPSLPAARGRSSFVQRTLAGRAFVQLGALSGRQFEWTIPDAEPSEVDNLVALFHGTWGSPPFYWYEPVSARVNMLSPESASPFAVDGLAGYTKLSGSGTIADGGTVTLPDGRKTAHSLALGAASTTAESPILPVIPGKMYAAWGVVTSTTSQPFTATLVYCDAAGAELGSGSGTVTTTASGVRVWATTLTGAQPAGTVGVRLRLASGAGGTTVRVPVARVAETTAVLTGWNHGRGLPAVAMTGVPEVLQDSTDNTRSSYTVSLVEV